MKHEEETEPLGRRIGQPDPFTVAAGASAALAKVGPVGAVRRSYPRFMRTLFTRVGAVALVVAATLAVAPAADAAPSWGPSVTLGRASSEIGTPAIAVAPDGEAVAAWVGSGSHGVQVSSRKPGRGWSPPVTISGIGEEIEGPRIAVSDRKAVIVWADTIRTRSGTAEVVLAATRLRGQRWSRPRNISAEKRWLYEPEGEEPQVTMTRRGKAIVVWKGRNEGHSTVSFIGSATQAAGDADWSPPVGIRGSYEGQEPQVGTTPAGETVAFWSASYNEESSIDAASRPANGRWGGVKYLSRPNTFPQLQLAITSRGEAIGAWVQEPEEGFGTVVQVAARRPGGKWKVRTLSSEYFGASPQIVTEPGSRATVLWGQGTRSGDHNIVASTHTPAGAWSEPTSVAAEGLNLPALSEAPIAVTRQGESIAIWSSATPGAGTTIQSSTRHRPHPWSEPTQVSTCPQSEAINLHLALARNGQAFAIWRAFNGNRWVIEATNRPAVGGRA